MQQQRRWGRSRRIGGRRRVRSSVVAVVVLLGVLALGIPVVAPLREAAAAPTVPEGYHAVNTSVVDLRTSGSGVTYDPGTDNEHTDRYCGVELWITASADDAFLFHNSYGDYWAGLFAVTGQGGQGGDVYYLDVHHQDPSTPVRDVSGIAPWTVYNPGVIRESQGNILGGNVGVRIYEKTFRWTEFTNPAYQVDDDVCEPGDLEQAKSDALELYRSTTTWVAFDPTDNQAPTSKFAYEVDPENPLQVTFVDLSTDPDGDALTYSWSFGDGTRSDEHSPVHVYSRAGSYRVSLTVTDTPGATGTSAQQVDLSTPLVVNSAGDGGAVDAAVRGCDTDAMVGGAPECTLRAAIETANARGGGEITFAIDAGGAVPSIAVGSSLPEVSASTSIDGLTQGDGGVDIDARVGGERGPRALVLAGGSSTVKGLHIGGASEAIVVSGGTGHVIEQSSFGVTSAGTKNLVAVGVKADGVPNLTITDNTFACYRCVDLQGSSGAAVSGNRIGVGPGELASGGGAGVGVVADDAPVTVSGNEISTLTLGVLVRGEGAAGSAISGNRVGQTSADVAVPSNGNGIIVDGARDVTVSGNVVVVSRVGIGVSGSVQVEDSEEVLVRVHQPGDALPNPKTGGGGSVSGNTVGLLADRSSPGSEAGTTGIWAWSAADGVAISANLVAHVTSAGVLVEGVDDARITGNTIGTDEARSTGLRPKFGVYLDRAADAVVGTAESPNTIRGQEAGVQLVGGIARAQVTGNDVVGGLRGVTSGTANTDHGPIEDPVITGNTIGGGESPVVVGRGTIGADVDGNTIEITTEGNEYEAGISVDEGVRGTSITENHITAAPTEGVLADGVGVGEGAASTTIKGNVIVAVGNGVRDAGTDTAISDNRIGIDTDGTVRGVQSRGVMVFGTATVSGNAVAGAGTIGIYVDGAATGRLSANRIYQSGETAIVTRSGPVAPEVTAAIRTSGSGEEDRTVLVVAGLPEAGVGKVEVFANDDCSDPEARYALGVSFAKVAGRSYALVPLIGRGDRDAFTVTYTDALTGTSALSGCEARGTYPDSDGDGSVDPIEDLGGTADDASTATVVTDTGVLVQVAATEGTLSGVGFVEDPAPGAHPGEFTLPYGVLGFVVEGLDRGASTTVAVAAVDGTSLSADAYWKYGPASPGAAPTWFAFDADEESGTGAELTTVDLGDSGFTRAWVLSLTDGARGDSDGTTDGRIVDPGGPALVPILPGTPEPTDPTDPTTPTGPTDPGSGTGAGTLDGVVTLTIPAAGPADAAAVDGTLPYTGSDDGYLLVLGAVLLTAGALTVGVTRRRRRA